MPADQQAWVPDPDAAARTQVAAFARWLAEHGRGNFEGYAELWRWSTTELDEFWQAVADFHDVRLHEPATTVLADRTMPGAVWFPGATLNYAEQALRHRGDHTAIVAFLTPRGSG